jgi:hypothetical protein
MGLQTYGKQEVETARAYFRGTTRLRRHQAICFEPLNDGVAVNKPDTGSDNNPNTFLGQVVNVMDAENLAYFAGLVSESSQIVGPGWIDIIIPRPGLNIEVEVDGDTDIVIDDSLELAVTQGGFIKDAVVGAPVYPRAYAHEAYTAAALALKWVMFY